MRAMGYEVTFREFEGRHELPPDIATEALAGWPRHDGSPAGVFVTVYRVDRCVPVNSY